MYFFKSIKKYFYIIEVFYSNPCLLSWNGSLSCQPITQLQAQALSPVLLQSHSQVAIGGGSTTIGGVVGASIGGDGALAGESIRTAGVVSTGSGVGIGRSVGIGSTWGGSGAGIASTSAIADGGATWTLTIGRSLRWLHPNMLLVSDGAAQRWGGKDLVIGWLANGKEIV